ncbi:MAG: hypothetical protein ACREUE_03805 [Panacagrimonas sp.]
MRDERKRWSLSEGVDDPTKKNASEQKEGAVSSPGELDRGNYRIGIKITDSELSELNLKLVNFHGHWNYTLLPQRKKT